MFLHTFYLTGLAVNTYIIGDEVTGRAIVVDPTRDIDPYINYALEEGYVITDIVETHVHADFISGSKELKHRLQGSPTIHCSAMDTQWTANYADKKVKDGDEIQLGSIRLKAMHTPGHTPEHLIWVCFDDTRSRDVPCLAFTGDLLFVGSVGRPDLLGKGEIQALATQLYHSLFTTIASLPDLLEIYPAHGQGSLCGKGLNARPSSTLGYERLFNPSLQKLPMEQWVEKLLEEMPSAPANFARMKKINVQGPELLKAQRSPTQEKLLYIDVRKPEIFAQGHIQGSINIPAFSNFCLWAGSVIPGDVSLGVVAGDAEQLAEVIKNLAFVGFDRVEQQLTWDDERMKKEFAVDTLPLCSVGSLAEKLGKDPQSLYLIDVRMPGEWNAGHVAGAHHLELATLADTFSTIPKDSKVYAICGSGTRSSIAGSLLKTKGYHSVENVQGGMMAWNKARLPTTK